MEDLWCFAPTFCSVEEGLNHQVCGVPHAHVPADDLTSENIDDGGQIDEIAAPRNVREVSGPENVGLDGTDRFGEIWDGSGWVSNVAWFPRLATHDLWLDAKLLHDAVDPLAVQAKEQRHPPVAVGWLLFTQGHDLFFDIRVFLGFIRTAIQGLTAYSEFAGHSRFAFSFCHTRPTLPDFFPRAFP